MWDIAKGVVAALFVAAIGTGCMIWGIREYRKPIKTGRRIQLVIYMVLIPVTTLLFSAVAYFGASEPGPPPPSPIELRQREEQRTQFAAEQKDLDAIRDHLSCPDFFDAPLGKKKCPEKEQLDYAQKDLDRRRGSNRFGW